MILASRNDAEVHLYKNHVEENSFRRWKMSLFDNFWTPFLPLSLLISDKPLAEKSNASDTVIPQIPIDVDREGPGEGKLLDTFCFGFYIRL